VNQPALLTAVEHAESAARRSRHDAKNARRPAERRNAIRSERNFWIASEFALSAYVELTARGA
jgi:hypothetical protein